MREEREARGATEGKQVVRTEWKEPFSVAVGNWATWGGNLPLCFLCLFICSIGPRPALGEEAQILAGAVFVSV